ARGRGPGGRRAVVVPAPGRVVPRVRATGRGERRRRLVVHRGDAGRGLGLQHHPRGVMLSPDSPVVGEFLRNSLVAHVASRSATGRAFVTPLWYTPHAGVLWVTTGLGTRL